MTFIIKDRVKQLASTTGTGIFTLAGQPTGYQAFSVIGDGNTTFYCISHQSADEWEVGIGTYTLSGTTLSRDTVLSSTNSGALVDFSSGTKDVLVTQPSSKAVTRNDLGKVGINTSEPDAMLHVAWGDIVIEKTHSSSAELAFHNDGTQIGRLGVDASEDMFLECDGNLNIIKPQAGTSDGDICFSIYQGQVTTTDATQTVVLTVPIPADTTVAIEWRAVARRTGGSAGSADDGAFYIRRCAYKTTGGSVAGVGAVQFTMTSEDQAGWTLTPLPSGNNVVAYVTGAVNNDVSWQCTAFVQKVSS